MKVIFNLLGIAVAGLLGYFSEPALRYQLTGVRPSPVEMATNGRVVLQLGKGAEINLDQLTPEQLPKQVLLNSDVKMSDQKSGITMSIQAGNRVNLLRIEGADAVVGPANSPFEGKVPIMSTDILQQLAANPPANAAHPAAPKVNAGSITDASSAPPDYSPAGESEEPVAVTPPPPVPEPAPAPAPIPDPVPAPVEDAVPEGPVDVVAVMKESVQSAQIKEFKADQVQEWTAGEQETVEGAVFQTGKVLYKATTFLGEKTIEAKAFIKGGKVQRWIWPRSGMEIR